MSQTQDSQGREVFAVHPEILAGGAGYRRESDGREQQPRRENDVQTEPAPREQPPAR